MRALLPSLALAVAAAAVAQAALAANGPHVQQRIVPGQAIGKIALGMGYAHVRRTLGPPQTVQRRTELGFDRRYVEYAWNYGAWVVGVEGRAGEMRVVRVGTSLSAQRTPLGVGPGSTVRAVVKRYPSAICVDRSRLDPYPGRWIVVPGRDGRMTAFEQIWFGGTYEASKPSRVASVVVQTRWLPTSAMHYCAPGWQDRE